MDVTIKTTMNKEVVAALIDQIEDFLEEKGVEIDNPDRDDDDEGAAIIYGDDYDRLCSDFMSSLENFGIHIVDTWEEVNDKPARGCSNCPECGHIELPECVDAYTDRAKHCERYDRTPI